jgi:hypothetical protein
LKIENLKQRPAQGSALIIAMFVCTALGIALGSFLLLVRSQNTAIVRSQAWNTALTLAEAGAEEALAQLNPDVGASVDRAANGWGFPSGGAYGPKSRTLSNDSYTVQFTTDTYPILYSTGYVAMPGGAATLTRVIRVMTTNVPLFGVAMGARQNIDMNGNNIVTDSFDSADTNLSNNGIYSSARASTNGDVASIAGVINVGGGDIHGDVYLGPTASDSVNNNGSVSGTTYHDFNVDFPDVVLPTATWFPVGLGLPSLPINGVIYNYTFMTSGDYQIAASGNIYVAPGARVRLKVVSGNFSPGVIRVAGTNAGAGNLQIYMTGASFTLSGQSIVDGSNASNLAYWGLPGNTSISFSGNAGFTGTIYAPSADFTLGGGGNNNQDFIGSSITKSVTMNGHFSFHFDENLLRAGAPRGYAVTAWREL